MSVSGVIKSMHLNDPSMNVVVVGNFDVASQANSVAFQQTGVWYDYFSGDSLNVTSLNQGIGLKPGEFHIYTTKRLAVPEKNLTDVEEKMISNNIPAEYSLAQNYPNPFNPSTVVSYSLPKSGMVTLKIYDILGHEVTTLVSGQVQAGEHTVKFDASGLASGIYICRMQSGSFISARKMMLLK
jgi:hypothetical protein